MGSAPVAAVVCRRGSRGSRRAAAAPWIGYHRLFRSSAPGSRRLRRWLPLFTAAWMLVWRSCRSCPTAGCSSGRRPPGSLRRAARCAARVRVPCGRATASSPIFSSSALVVARLDDGCAGTRAAREFSVNGFRVSRVGGPFRRVTVGSRLSRQPDDSLHGGPIRHLKLAPRVDVSLDGRYEAAYPVRLLRGAVRLLPMPGRDWPAISTAIRPTSCSHGGPRQWSPILPTQATWRLVYQGQRIVLFCSRPSLDLPTLGSTRHHFPRDSSLRRTG